MGGACVGSSEDEIKCRIIGGKHIIIINMTNISNKQMIFI